MKPDLYPMRLLGWLAGGLLLLAASWWLGADYPQPQVMLWKLGQAAVSAWVAYWICRGALGRIDRESPGDGDLIARAVLMGCVVLGVTLGL